MKIKGGYLSNNESIQKYLGFNVKLLSFIGLQFSLNDNRPIKKSLFLQKLPIFVTNVMGVIVGILEVLYIRDTFARDIDLTAQICCELFSNVLCISKGFGMARGVEHLQMVFKEVSTSWEKYRPNEECSAIILKKANNTLTLCRCYLTILICGILTFTIPPLLNITFQYLDRETTNHTYDYSKRVFYFMYPFEVNNLLIYLSVFLEEEYLLLASALFWLGCDTLFAQLTTHASIQLEILQYDIQTLINEENVEDHLKENVIILIKRHQALLRICNLIEHVFSPVILTTMVLSALNICANAFEASQMMSQGHHIGTALYAILVVILFFQIIFYCTFAETLTEQTSLIANSIYNCEWTKKNHKLRFYFQMIILKSQTPFYCTAYGFFPIGHERFAAILSTSYTYYMMLQTVN